MCLLSIKSNCVPSVIFIIHCPAEKRFRAQFGSPLGDCKFFLGREESHPKMSGINIEVSSASISLKNSDW